ncbi:MAG: M28 family peptidase, partial [Pseudomonadota bacterium]
GTEAEARARDWAVERLNALGFDDVRVETFDMPVWVRGEERAEIVAPFPQPLTLTALGNSAATPAEGLEAEIVMFESVAALEAAPNAAVAGKIVYIGHAMRATQDGSHYGQFGAPRRQGPNVAAAKGAAAIVIRSIGTDSARSPHTGVQRFADGVTPIPAAALANPDADQLERIAARGQPVRLNLVLTPRQTGTGTSGNVIAEVPGRDPDAGMILVACHLDSWDLGTGAVDDAAGCGIVTAAAKRVMDAGTPRRPIRIVWFGAEEVGLFGGFHYAETHAEERHALVAESDFGAGTIWRYDSRLPAAAAPLVTRTSTALAPLGIALGRTDRASGSDITPLVNAGNPVVQLQQDGTNYFDWHHTPDDTLDKVDAAEVQQNVAAWTVMLSLAANADEDLLAE